MNAADPTVDAAAPWWLLVVEPAPRWAPAARLALTRYRRPDAARRIASAAGPPPLDCLLSCSQPVVVGLSLDAAETSETLRLFSRLRESPSLCPVALLAIDPPTGCSVSAAAACREAGAAAAFESPLAIDELLSIGDRHARRVGAESMATLSVAERHRLRLPWQSAPWDIP